MAYKFVWITAGEKTCYACERWNGAIFESANALPELPVHPNCKCYVHAFNAQTNELYKALESVKFILSQSQEEGISLQPYLKLNFLKNIISDISACIYGFEQIYQTCLIFLENFQDMREANTKYADKYFHSKANAQAAQLGSIAEETAKYIGWAREISDLFKNKYKYKMDLVSSILDIMSDLRANAYGRRIGRQHPTEDIRYRLDKYRPPYLDEEY